MDKRSEAYYQAGVELLSKQLYCQGIACFYYSVLQMMWYSLTVSPLRPLDYDSQNPLDEDIHKRTLENIISRLSDSRDVDRVNYLFRDNMLPLRKKADYDPEMCTLDECALCREWCDSLRSLLGKRFKHQAA